MSIGRQLIKLGIAHAVMDTALFPLIRRIRRLQGPAIHVLGYHRVLDRIDRSGPLDPALAMTTASFRKQMEQVRARFRVLRMEEALAVMRRELSLERDACVITFDDGYRDVYLRAHPILKDLGLPATVFVPTGPAESGQALLHDRLHAALWHLGQRHSAHPAATVEALIHQVPSPALGELTAALEALGGGPLAVDASVMSPEEIRSLSRQGWEIGAHTVDHVTLTHESLERIRSELQDSRQALESWTARACRYFAYCNGLYNETIVAEARRAGYEAAVTTWDRVNHLGEDVMHIGRKCLSEAHTRGLFGGWSATVSAAHLHDIYGAFFLTRPVTGFEASHA